MSSTESADPARNPPAMRRPYSSPKRAAAAAETRRRIVAAASEVFAERGWAGTTLPLIAQRAEVSVESVNANGPKRALLLAAFEQTFSGREGTDPQTARPELAHVLSAPRPADAVAAMADFILAGQARGIGIWRALQAAAAEDAEVGRLYEDLAERRRADNLAAVRALDARGMVRRDRSLEEHADTMALLNGFDPYQLFVREFGWTHEQLRAWWIDTVLRLVLMPLD